MILDVRQLERRQGHHPVRQPSRTPIVIILAVPGSRVTAGGVVFFTVRPLGAGVSQRRCRSKRGDARSSSPAWCVARSATDLVGSPVHHGTATERSRTLPLFASRTVPAGRSRTKGRLVARHRAARRRGWLPAPRTEAAQSRARRRRPGWPPRGARGGAGGAFTVTERLGPVGGCREWHAVRAGHRGIVVTGGAEGGHPVRRAGPAGAGKFDLGAAQGRGGTEREVAARSRNEAELAAVVPGRRLGFGG